jgi:hypothetical protein
MTEEIEVIAVYLEKDVKDGNIASTSLQGSSQVGDVNVIHNVSKIFANRFGIPQSNLIVEPINPGQGNVKGMNIATFCASGGVFQVFAKDTRSANQERMTALEDVIRLQNSNHMVERVDLNSKMDNLKKLYIASLAELGKVGSEKSLHSQVCALENEVKELKTEIQYLKTENQNLKTDIQYLKTENRTFQNDIKVLKKIGFISIRETLNQFRQLIFSPNNDNEFYDDFIKKIVITELPCANKLKQLEIDETVLNFTLLGKKNQKTIQRQVSEIAHTFDHEGAAILITGMSEGAKRDALSKIFKFVTDEDVDTYVFDEEF